MNFEKTYDSPYNDTDVGLKRFMTGVYSWMTIGILLTAVISLVMERTGAVKYLLTNGIFLILSVLEIVLVMIFSFRVWKMSKGAATAVYLAYSALNGVTLSSIFLVYTNSSIAATFFTAAAMFGIFSIYGLLTKGDLTHWSRPLMMGLIGLIIVSIVNLFLKSDRLDWIISIVGVVLFSLLTVYDTFKLKKLYLTYNNNNDTIADDKISIWGALTLYLDFINLFLYMLRFLGKKKN